MRRRPSCPVSAKRSSRKTHRRIDRSPPLGYPMPPRPPMRLDSLGERLDISLPSAFPTSAREIPNCLAIRDGGTPALKAARTALTFPRSSDESRILGLAVCWRPYAILEAFSLAASARYVPLLAIDQTLDPLAALFRSIDFSAANTAPTRQLQETPCSASLLGRDLAPGEEAFLSTSDEKRSEPGGRMRALTIPQ